MLTGDDREKAEELALTLHELMESGPADVKPEYRKLYEDMLALINPEAARWGEWEWDGKVSGAPMMRIPDVGVLSDNEIGLQVSFYKGQVDGKPVIQIDGSGDFRINVNDCPVWDQSTEQKWTGGTNAAD